MHAFQVFLEILSTFFYMLLRRYFVADVDNFHVHLDVSYLGDVVIEYNIRGPL